MASVTVGRATEPTGRSGGSESPATLLRRLDIDITQPEFWQRGLSVIRRLVEEAKALAEP